ncbi:MAG: sporulation integral membrane protein YtvI [Oscillospiraceae bacterium]|nr:sporulation integral membrane protein YtvI [Oscillospiraceae bacterium]
MLERRKRFLINILFWAAIIALVYVIFKYLLPFLMPFFIAALIAIFTRPLARIISRKTHIKLNIVALICTLVCFIIVAGLIAVIVIRLTGWATELFSALPSIYTDTIEPALTNFSERIAEQMGRLNPDTLAVLERVSDKLIDSLGDVAIRLSNWTVNGVKNIVTGLPNFLLSCVVCVIAAIFITLDYEKIKETGKLIMPDRTIKVIMESSSNLRKIIGKYLKAYGVIMLITFAEIAIGLLIIGVKNAILIAVLIAIFDIFPIVGSGMILLPWTVITLIQGHIMRGIGLGILYVIVIVVRQFLEPRVVGKHVGMHPLLTLACMFVGAHLFGGIGLFGVPVTAAVILSLNENGVINIFRTTDTEGWTETPPDLEDLAEPEGPPVDSPEDDGNSPEDE